MVSTQTLSKSGIVILILSLIVVGLLGYVFFKGDSNEYKDKYEKQKKAIDSLTTRINVLALEQLKQDSIIKQNKDSIAVLDVEIKEKEKKIEDIRKKHGKKIKDIGTATPSELSNFFTERYK